MTYKIISKDYPDYDITINAPYWCAIGVFNAIHEKEPKTHLMMVDQTEEVVIYKNLK